MLLHIFPQYLFQFKNSFLIIFLRFYLFIHERHGERGRDIGREREKHVPCGEPHVQLHPGTPGSCPELKADAQPLSHPGISNSCPKNNYKILHFNVFDKYKSNPPKFTIT